MHGFIQSRGISVCLINLPFVRKRHGSARAIGHLGVRVLCRFIVLSCLCYPLCIHCCIPPTSFFGLSLCCFFGFLLCNRLGFLVFLLLPPNSLLLLLGFRLPAPFLLVFF